MTDIKNRKEQFWILYGRQVWGVPANALLLVGEPVVFENGTDCGKVRACRSAAVWKEHVGTRNICVIESKGNIYLYAIFCVCGSSKEKLNADTKRLRHVPTVVAEAFVKRLYSEIANQMHDDSSLQKFEPILRFKKTPSQQIMPQLTEDLELGKRWVFYRNVKTVPTAEIDHAPKPRKKPKSTKSSESGDAVSSDATDPSSKPFSRTVVLSLRECETNARLVFQPEKAQAVVVFW